MVSSSHPSIAIAFGGGGARGIAHIHVLEVMDELGIRPVAIAGSSIGAIIGAGMASGMSGRDVREYMTGIFAHRAEVARRMWQARPSGLADMFNGGLKISQFNVEKVLSAFLPEAVPATFADLKIPMMITASDLHAAKEVTITEGNLASAIAASSAIPPLFAPVQREGRILIDGGIFNPVPFDLLFDKADIVIGVDVIGAPDCSEHKMPSTLEAMFAANQLMMRSIITNKFLRQRPQIFLSPNVRNIGILDFLKIGSILKQSAGIRDELKRAIAEQFEKPAILPAPQQ